MSSPAILNIYTQKQITEWAEESIEDQCGLRKNGTGHCCVVVTHKGERIEVFTSSTDDNEDMGNQLIEYMSKKTLGDLEYELSYLGKTHCCLWLKID